MKIMPTARMTFILDVDRIINCGQVKSHPSSHRLCPVTCGSTFSHNRSALARYVVHWCQKKPGLHQHWKPLPSCAIDTRMPRTAGYQNCCGHPDTGILPGDHSESILAVDHSDSMFWFNFFLFWNRKIIVSSQWSNKPYHVCIGEIQTFLEKNPVHWMPHRA